MLKKSLVLAFLAQSFVYYSSCSAASAATNELPFQAHNDSVYRAFDIAKKNPDRIIGILIQRLNVPELPDFSQRELVALNFAKENKWTEALQHLELARRLQKRLKNKNYAAKADLQFLFALTNWSAGNHESSLDNLRELSLLNKKHPESFGANSIIKSIIIDEANTISQHDQ
ncbi:MAG TPA: tetratricopeptide repeat protein [Candidatus Melainabacteria bacterium]|nr:tetratricopeptide repeat protein [Candidatus Melainabacteria bacterium]